MPNINTGSGGDTGATTNAVSQSRRINTSAPLSGGGDLSADRTLSIDTSGFGDVYKGGGNIFTGSNTFTGSTRFTGPVLFTGGTQISGAVSVYTAARMARINTLAGSIGLTFSNLGLMVASLPIYAINAPLSANRYVVSGELSGAGSSGTVTSIATGSNLIAAPTTITTTGSIALAPTIELGDAGSQLHALYGNQANASGYHWLLAGSGNIAGTLNVNADTAQDRVRFSGIPVFIDAVGDAGLQVSGAVRLYDRVEVGDPSSQLQALYGAGANAQGWQWLLAGSGNVAGTVQFNADTAGNRIRFAGIPTYFDRTGGAGVQVSGVARLYGSIGAGPVADSMQVGDAVPLSYQWLYGGTPDTAGYSHYLVGSGQLAGTTRFTKAAGVRPERVEFNAIDAVFGASMAAPNVIVSAQGDLQASGLVQAYKRITVGPATDAGINSPPGTVLYGGAPNSAGFNLVQMGSGGFWGTQQFLGHALTNTDKVTFALLKQGVLLDTDTPLVAAGDVQVSGVMVAHRRLGIGVEPQLIGFPPLGGQAFYGTQADLDGNRWRLYGSGIVVGKTTFQALAAEDIVQFSVPVVHDTGGLQVSGGVLYAYHELLVQNTVDQRGARFDTLPDTTGVSWAVTGSGIVTGATTFQPAQSRDRVTFAVIPVDFNGGVVTTIGSANLKLAGNLQISGATNLVYRPLYATSVAAGNRYVVSGELAAGGSTGNVSNTASVYWTGAAHVFSATTAVQVSGVQSWGSTGGTRISAIGDVQTSGAVRAYGAVTVGPATDAGINSPPGTVLYGGAPNSAGFNLVQMGSGGFWGTQQFLGHALTNTDKVTFALLKQGVLLDTDTPLVAAGDVQVSGTMLSYAPATLRQSLTVSGDIYQANRRWASVEQELGMRTADERLTNRALATAYDAPFRSPLKQTVTLASGESQIHGWIYARGYLVGSTRTTPGKLVRFNTPEDLTDYTTLNFPNDGFHGVADDVVYVPDTDRAYIAFGSTPSGIRVAEIDLPTLDYSIRATTGLATNSTSVASDGTYLYVVPGGTSPDSYVNRWSLADWTFTSLTVSNAASGHTLRYDGRYLFLTTASSPGSVHRITTSPFAVDQSQTFFVGDNVATDDFCDAGDYLYVGLETTTGIVLRIAKATLTIERIATGVLSQCYGTYFDGRYVWAGYNTSPGTLVRIDPHSLEMRRFTLATGENSVNEIASDGSRLFLTCWLSPAKVVRLTAPPMDAAGVSYVTASGGQYWAVSQDGSVTLGGGAPLAGVQISGAAALVYGPAFQGMQSTANRYVTSGELSAATTSSFGDLQVSGTLRAYSSVVIASGIAAGESYRLEVRSGSYNNSFGIISGDLIGGGLTLKNTYPGGVTFDILSTGPNAALGVGKLGVFSEASAYVASVDGVGNMVLGRAAGGIQISGGQTTHYGPIWQGAASGANRYVVSGELVGLPSDLRLKTNLTPLSGLAYLRHLEGVRFEWRAQPGRLALGMVAQQTEPWVPEVISPDASGWSRIDYPRLVPVLVQAVNELDARLQQLEGAPRPISRVLSSGLMQIAAGMGMTTITSGLLAW